MSNASSTAQTLPPAPSHHHAPFHDYPIGALAGGLVILFFALWGLSTQLATSEAWYENLSAASVSLAPHFAILAQPWDYFQGRMNGLQMQAFTWAWGVEVVQFLVSTGLLFSTFRHNRFVSWICVVGGVLIMIFDSVADYLFNRTANAWQQLGFTIIIFLMAFGLMYYALHLIIVKGIITAIRTRRLW